MRFLHFKSFNFTWLQPERKDFLSKTRENRIWNVSEIAANTVWADDNHEIHDDVWGFYGPRVSFTSCRKCIVKFLGGLTSRVCGIWKVHCCTNCFIAVLQLIHCSFFHLNPAQSKDKQEDFECPTNAGNGNYADPVTCRRFYQVSVSLKFVQNIKNIIVLDSAWMDIRIWIVALRAFILMTSKSSAHSRMKLVAVPLLQVNIYSITSAPTNGLFLL